MKLLLQLCVLVLLCGSVLPCVAAPSLVDHYRNALAADPQNQTLRYHYGVALLSQNENRQALAEFRAVYAQRANDPELNFNLALAYTRLNDPDSALIFLDQAVTCGAGEQPEIYPLQNAFFNLVLLYAQRNQLAEAVQLLQRLVEENPSQVEYLRLLGDYQLRLGHFTEALAALDAYLQQMPADNEMREYAFAAFFNHGLAAYEKQDFAAARQEFLRALRFAEQRPSALYYLALLDYQQEDYLRVAEHLPQIYPRLNPELKNSARAMLYNTALSLKQQARLTEARQVLEPLSSDADPRTKDLLLLAGIRLAMGDFELARQGYARVLQVEPSLSAAAYGIQAAERGAFEENLTAALAAFAAEDLAAVRLALARAAEIYAKDNRLRIYQARLAKAAQDNWLALERQAQELEGRRRYAEALALLRKGLRFAPREPRLLGHEKRLLALLAARIDELYHQGEELYARGELPSALGRFRQLVQLSPEHQAGQNYLEKIADELQHIAQRAIGAGEAALARADLDGARQAFQRALAACPEEPAALAGVTRVEQLLAARVAETLVQAKRLAGTGDLPAARGLLRESLGAWSSPLLAAELLRIETALGQRQKLLVSAVRTALGQQEFSRALQLLKQAAQLDSDAAVLTTLRAEFETARRQAVEAQLELARRQFVQQQFALGLKAYRQVLDIEPANAEALAGLKRGRDALSASIAKTLTAGANAHKAGDFALAQRIYREVLLLDPHRAEALAALRQLERAGQAGLSGADSGRLYLQGIEFYTTGDYAQAIAAWRQVLDLDPAHEKAKMNIDKAERKLAQIRERQRG